MRFIKRINDQKFTDNQFPPHKNSLYNKQTLTENNNKYFQRLLIFNFNVVNWARPEDINNEWLYLYNNPDPSDVVQGSIGTCWFLSALASLANYPNYFSSIFFAHELSEQGVYQFNLCIRGQLKIVTIDDYLPCNIAKKTVFAGIKNNQLYAALLEKALAKVHGNFASIISGYCVEGLQILTGHPCEIIQLKDKVNEVTELELWNKVKNAFDSAYVMTCLCSYQTSKIRMLWNGLFDSHIYSILDVKEFCYNEEQIRLVKLRNPWGSNGWRGKWWNDLSGKPKFIKGM